MQGQTSTTAKTTLSRDPESQPLTARSAAEEAAKSAKPTAHKHVPALDGIRGLAIGLVLLLHFVGNTLPHTGFEQALVKAANYGTYGVALFFVLSGYLITGILIDAKGQPGYFRNFYMRRMLRIFPLYYGVLLVGLWLLPDAWAPAGLAASREHQAWLWGYVANFFVAKEQRWEALPYFNHFWSLAVEEHFYFLWPLLVARSSARGLLWWAGGLSLLALVLRVGLAATGAHELVTYTITPTRMDGLCLGGMLAAWVRRPGGLEQVKRWAPWVSGGALLYSVLGYVLMRRFWPEGHRVYFEARETAVLLLFACLLVWVITSPPRSPLARAFTSRPMITLGKYSYGLYVFHAMISWYFAQERTEDWVTAQVGSHTLAVFLQASFGVAASFAIALLSFHLMEKRFLSLKARFEAKPQAA